MSKTQYCDDRASMAGFRDGLNLYDTSNISYNEKQTKIPHNVNSFKMQ